MPKHGIASATCTATGEEYVEFVDRFLIPSCYDHVLPNSGHTALDVPPGYVALYLPLFTVGNFLFPLNKFFLDVLNFFQCHISLLNPFGVVRLSSFAVACKACGGELTLSLFRSLFTLGPAGDWLTFQKRHGDSVPFIFKASMLHIPGWKSKFIFVHEDLFSDQYPGIVTQFRHRLGTFSSPFPSEPFNVSLRTLSVTPPNGAWTESRVRGCDVIIYITQDTKNDL
ncbi:hypothetical protein Tco_0945280 [Tanacetum coccineum]